MRDLDLECIMTDPRLTVELADNEADICASQALRYRIFAQEQGANLPAANQGIDQDHYDPFCYHLLVREIDTQEIVGSTRILTDQAAKLAGGFYSENEFNLDNLLPLKGNAIEIGRTCIRQDYRNGLGIGMLWLGLAQFIKTYHIDYMFGCASVSTADGGVQINAIMEKIRDKHLAPNQYHVTPRNPIISHSSDVRAQLPPLLKAYLKLGAWIGGEACLDKDFNVADIFILLDVNNLNTRYHRHFVQRNQPQTICKPSGSQIPTAAVA